MLISLMPISLWVMLLLGLAAGATGLPVLLRGPAVRRRLGLRDAPETIYLLRIVGAMLSALGLILITFALVYATANG
jgi:hypothetical protein